MQRQRKEPIINPITRIQELRMKRRFPPALSLVLVGALTCTLGAARYEITPTISKKIYNYSADRALQDGKLFYGIRGSLYLNRKTAVLAGVEISNTNRMGDGGDTDVERILVGATYEPLAHKNMRIQPYLIAGGGYEKVHREIPGVSSQGYYTAGGGLKIKINPKTDLVTEARLIHKMDDEDDDIMGTLGVGFKLGDLGECLPPKTAQKRAMSLAELAALCQTQKKWVKPADVTSSHTSAVPEATPESTSEAPAAPATAPSTEVTTPAKKKETQKPIIVEESYPKDLKPEEIEEIKKAEQSKKATTVTRTVTTQTTPATSSKQEIKPVLAQPKPSQSPTFEGPLVYDDNEFVNVCDQHSKPVLEEISTEPKTDALETVTLPSCKTTDTPKERILEKTPTGYFVQLAALRRSSPDPLIKKLDRKNLSYTLMQKGDITAVLAGPFESRAEAKRILPTVRSISKDAFILYIR